MDIDLSFVTDTFQPIKKAIEDTNSPLIKKYEVVDIYEDENGKSISVRITFSHPEKTLTREEVSDVYTNIIDTLKAQGIALKG
jgi:phenylalanyl-tRNA synthetase beta chain